MNWDYNLLARRDGFAGNPEIEVVVPSDAVVAGVYIQAISAHAPHPNAAKLWMEYLYSDEGQLGWLKGYCHPIRFNDIAARGVHSAGTARRAARGRELCQGRVPLARGAGRRQGLHRRPTGTASSAPTSSKHDKRR